MMTRPHYRDLFPLVVGDKMNADIRFELVDIEFIPDRKGWRSTKYLVLR
jgi:hypothetical protein